ncbi:PREDICTED: uncharacterized protein LOC109239682 [Nicotiana attenuata]|uniref:uncharacterized protein LOC109239682 n=1 Tax=Nicotiana attenuata TaxID=49451 RepID=UPI000904D16F|nr:PREDICTED: uncharacterized protein LOC109239682 [Nicotiana attenuata]
MGQAALTKLAGLVGKPLKADRATTQKERLTYARVLVEVKPHQKYPYTIMFEDERGRIVEQEVFYEWKPTLCGKCKNFGHEMNECRRFIKEEREKQANKQELKEPTEVQTQKQVEKKNANMQNKGEHGQKQQVIGPISKGNTGNEVVTIGNEDHQQEKAEAANENVVENRNNKGKGSEMALGKWQDGGNPSSNG